MPVEISEKQYQEFSRFKRLYKIFGVLIVVIGIAALIMLVVFVKQQVTIIKFESQSYKTQLKLEKSYLEQLSRMIYESQILTNSWIDHRDDTPEKQKLKSIQNDEFMKLKEILYTNQNNWSSAEKSDFQQVCGLVESLFQKQQLIMFQLNKPESYNDIPTKFEVDLLFGKAGELTQIYNNIDKKLQTLIQSRQAQIEK